VEEALIEEFEDAHHQGNIARMRNCAETLLPFKVCVVLGCLLGICSSRHQEVSPPTNLPPRNHSAAN